MIVVSTAFEVPAWAEGFCRASVKMQRRPTEHVYVHSAPDRAMTQNLYDVVKDLPPDEIVVSLDGDDWLARDDALDIVQKAYDDGAWLTYGQFRYHPYAPGWAQQYPSDDYRALPWYGTHLKTFRAGLFQHILLKDLQDADGHWLRLCCDQAFMLPMLEMAGQERSRFIPEVIYCYNWTPNPNSARDYSYGSKEWRATMYVRGLSKYDRLSERPW